MSSSSKTDAANLKLEEERMIQYLITRSLVTNEEVQRCRPDGKVIGAEPLLGRLVQAGFLTASQAHRVGPEAAGSGAQLIPGYQVLAKLGQGATGSVVKARQLSMDRLVAIKVLQPRLAENPDFLDRFRREAHTAAKLSHNNVVQAIDVGSVGKMHYFVMEYVEGTTIKQELEQGKVFDEQEAVEVVLQICQALDHAHRRGLVHRDVKPANIIRTADGVAKLADLGMARETADEETAQQERGIAIGTPYYMSPEQIEGAADIDGRADIYALGATLYHMVTGQVPFPGKTVDAVLQAHLDKELTPPDRVNDDLSPELGQVVGMMMAKDRDDRYQSAEELIIDLECLLNGEPPRLGRKPGRGKAAREEPEEEEPEPEEEEERKKKRRKKRKKEEEETVSTTTLWLWILSALLAVSVLLNLLSLVRRLTE
jgi:serine/threonine-protein kinase